jgi:hypothetical protein
MSVYNHGKQIIMKRSGHNTLFRFNRLYVRLRTKRSAFTSVRLKTLPIVSAFGKAPAVIQFSQKQLPSV